MGLLHNFCEPELTSLWERSVISMVSVRWNNSTHSKGIDECSVGNRKSTGAHQRPLHSERLTVRCEISSFVVLDLYFFEDKECVAINPLALELDIYSLAHHLCKMLIFYKPRSVTPGNNKTFCRGINNDGERKCKK